MRKHGNETRWFQRSSRWPLRDRRAAGRRGRRPGPPQTQLSLLQFAVAPSQPAGLHRGVLSAPVPDPAPHPLVREGFTGRMAEHSTRRPCRLFGGGPACDALPEPPAPREAACRGLDCRQGLLWTQQAEEDDGPGSCPPGLWVGPAPGPIPAGSETGCWPEQVPQGARGSEKRQVSSTGNRQRPKKCILR